MTTLDRMLDGLPRKAQNTIYGALDNLRVMSSVGNLKVAASMAPSVYRGLIKGTARDGDAVQMPGRHAAHFSLTYQGEFPEMYDLYRRAVANQWNGDRDLDWATSVDLENPDTMVMPLDYPPFAGLEAKGIKLNDKEKLRFANDIASWTLSQFMHGEQGALYAAAQVTESVQWMDGKFYGATQVMDEGRHLEVFLRYLDTKLQKVYAVNDNLFVILDDLLTDSRWDVKFLGMQIMVEGLALGAFGTMYNFTREPLLKQLLKYVIQDEARHVHYGVLALREHITKELTPAEVREREDWSYEVALLMRNRFLSHEIYYEWFEGRLSLKDWDEVILNAPSMAAFRHLMFLRLIPNLEYIGLMSDRIKAHYEKAGLTSFLGGKNATQLSADDLIRDISAYRAPVTAH
ncbi:ferritin-like domain-containing protein [Fontimonas sp. SYSU GA230001]|uniref:ferritin-like domain-containing protein n=1 Tax=Fontimonas sp. SYSU GA230001 TaxID=3142450 RepID=UPI0032B5BC03